jgi:two-component system alkaline phosphatase synthesis response regulator PhoP
MLEKYLIYSVEDDQDIGHIINATLSKQGYEVITFPDGESFLDAFALRKPKMILLDLMLPGIQGKDLLKEIRSKKANDDIQVLIISAKNLPIDKVGGLDLGADDYIEKPFDLLELMSRVNAHARRNRCLDAIEVGDLRLDLSADSLTKKDENIELTPSEFKIIVLLFKNAGKVVTRQQIAEELYGDSAKEDSRTIDMHIKSIRAKIGDKDQNLILSVYGSGYKIP